MAKNNADDTGEFKFPDEENAGDKKPDSSAGNDDLEIEIEDDTPEEDRGREPMPKEVVEDFENDELEDYSDTVKQRFKQSKKLYHDERRRAEREAREKQEAVKFAQRMMEENRQLKTQYSQGEQSYMQMQRNLAEREAAIAEREWRDAYESGDTDKIAAAQSKLSSAQYQLNALGGFVPRDRMQDDSSNSQVPLQQQPQQVSNNAQQQQAVRVDPKTQAWQERNTWFGTDPEMTSAALGLHQKLLTENGPEFAQTDDYFKTIDTTMRRRFPEYFDGEDMEDGGDKTPKSVPKANVVAPATRSRSSKKIRLTQSQVALAEKLGLTPQEYAKEVMKLEG